MWQSYVTITQSVPQDTYSKELTEHLMSLMCRSRFANGSVAAGVARRAQGAMFRGSLPAIFDRLRGKECGPAAALPPRLLQRLATAVDAATGK